MSQSRITHVGKFYPPHMGGIETHLQNLCRELAKSHSVEAIVANDGPGSVAEMDGSVYVRRCGTRFTACSAPICPGLISAIRTTRAEILHLHLPNPVSIAALLASGYSGPVVTTYHSDIVRQKILGAVVAPFLNLILHRSAAIICTSEQYLNTSPVLARFRDKCVVIPYGVPSTGISDAEPYEISAIRRRYGPHLILAVGRLVYYKGFKYLVEAMRRVHGKLLIIGDGPLRGELERRIIEADLQDKVQLLGEIQNGRLGPYYRAADVFALSSVARSEAFGIVQLEAMACGVPVVNTDLDSGVPFVSRHNETGLTVPPGDAPALAHALNALLSDPALRAAFSDAARRRIRAEFTLERMARRTENLYRNVLGARVPTHVDVRSKVPARAARTEAAAKTVAG